MRFLGVRSILATSGIVLACYACGSSSSSSSSSSGGVGPEGGLPVTEGGSGADGSMGGNDAGGDTSTGGGNCTPACTGAHVTCDPADNKCKPDGTTTKIGGMCTASGTDPMCGTDPAAGCNNQAADGFPGGYCTFEPCSATVLCPIGSSCAHLGGETAACWKNCATDNDCRSPDYKCLAVDPLFTSGASHKVCFLKDVPCGNGVNADCPAAFPTCKGPDGGAPPAGGGICK